MQKEKTKFNYLLLWVCGFVWLSGCTNWDVHLAPKGSPSDEQICQSFESIQVKVSDAADVLATIAKPPCLLYTSPSPRD